MICISEECVKNRGAAGVGRPVIHLQLQQGSSLDVGRHCSHPVALRQLYYEVRKNRLRRELAYKVQCCHGSSACRQQVVMKQHDIIRCQCIRMNFKRVGTILLHVFFRVCVTWQLAGLAYRDEACAKFICQCRPKNESAGFQAGDLGNAFILVKFVYRIYGLLERISILEKRSYVPEKDPLLGEIRNGRMLETSNSLSIRLECKFHHSEKTMVGNPVKVSVDKSVGRVHVFGNVILSILRRCDIVLKTE